MTAQVSERARHVGPPLAAPALAFVGLFVLSLILGPVLGSGPTPSPFSSADVIQHYFVSSQLASQVNGFLQFDAAIALGVFSAVMLSRMRFLAPNVPGPMIGATGGIIASIFLALCGLLQWVLSQPGVVDQPALVRALQYLFFLCGGPAHTVGLGLLVAGIGVTAWFMRALPVWLCAIGVAIAVVSVLAILVMLVPALAPLIPIGRFTAMIWIVAVSFLLPRTRRPRQSFV